MKFFEVEKDVEQLRLALRHHSQLLFHGLLFPALIVEGRELGLQAEKIFFKFPDDGTDGSLQGNDIVVIEGILQVVDELVMVLWAAQIDG